MNAKRATLIVAAMTALLASCTVGPKYSKATVPTAPAYGEQPPEKFKEAPGWN
jgi:hypothetical protein